MIVGLTGGIGSGKSVVSHLFVQLGVECIDADFIARELVQSDSLVFSQIVSYFGPEILLPSGELNRRLLRELIFSQVEKKRWLENLLHPLIRAEIQKRVKQFKSPYAIVVIPLLFENGAYPYIDRVLLVDAPESLQVERIMRRDQLTKAEAENILAHQVTRAHRIKHAHDIILNVGSREELAKQVQALHHKYLVMAQTERFS